MMSFRTHIHKSLLINCALSLIAFGGIRLLGVHLDTENALFIALILGFLEFCFFYYAFDIDMYRERMKFVLPEVELKSHQFIFMLFFPIYLCALTFYLYWDHKAPMVSKISFKKLYITTVPLVLLQFASPGISYFTAFPSQYYITGTIHSSVWMIHYKEQLKNSDDVVTNYFKMHSPRMNSTEMILLVAVASAVTIGDKNRAVASGENRIEASFKYALRIMEFSHQNISNSEQQKFSYFDYSPVHWIYPSGLTQILLLTAVENDVVFKFQKTLLDQNFKILRNMENKLESLNPDQKFYYQNKFVEIKAKFHSTETYKHHYNKI